MSPTMSTAAAATCVPIGARQCIVTRPGHDPESGVRFIRLMRKVSHATAQNPPWMYNWVSDVSKGSQSGKL